MIWLLQVPGHSHGLVKNGFPDQLKSDKVEIGQEKML